MRKSCLFLVLIVLLCLVSCDTLTHRTISISVDRESSMTVEMLDFVLDTADASSGEITISLLWDSADDLDLHVITPSGERINFNNPQADGGILDVDMNWQDFNISRNPVENIYFTDPLEGTYLVKVVNFNDRTPGRDTNYLVRVVISNVPYTFTGYISGTNTEHDVFEFTYPLAIRKY